jgi:hypothetical protein
VAFSELRVVFPSLTLTSIFTFSVFRLVLISLASTSIFTFSVLRIVLPPLTLPGGVAYLLTLDGAKLLIRALGLKALAAFGIGANLFHRTSPPFWLT